MAFAATIGFFDGVHKGHRYLLRELSRVAAERGLQSAVLTMDEHPETVLRGTIKPLLTTSDERCDLLHQAGIDQVFTFHFDVIREMTAVEFMRFIHERYHVDVLLMGYDHRFGSDRLTEFADYEACAKQAGMALIPVPVAPEGEVSSSKIRKALMEGDIERANAMLGYNYRLSGTVVHGNGIGHKIGFPTANIKPEACKLVPAAGVYKAIRCVVNIGTNPTVGNKEVTIEAHLLDYSGEELYGKTLTLEFERRIRAERKFDSLEELRKQIAEDIKNAAS